jgi:hypothetical protein
MHFQDLHLALSPAEITVSKSTSFEVAGASNIINQRFITEFPRAGRLILRIPRKALKCPKILAWHSAALKLRSCGF